MDHLSSLFADNSLVDGGQAILAFLGLWLVFILFHKTVKKRAHLSANKINRFLLSQLSKLGVPVCLPLFLMIATRFLKPMPEIHTWIFYFLVAGIAFRTVRFVQALILFVLDQALSTAEGEHRTDLVMLRNLNWIVSAALWLLAGIFILSNAGVNVSSALTGLGIGGVAIALSAQKVLGDLLASISLLLDKPFRIGDLITVNDSSGTVERIGMRTTLLRSVDGEELILPNAILASSKISNFGRATRRRVSLHLALPVDAPIEHVRNIASWITETLSSQSRVQLESVQLSSLGKSSLDYTVSYFVPANDPSFTKDAHHEANLAILDRLKREGVVLWQPPA